MNRRDAFSSLAPAPPIFPSPEIDIFGQLHFYFVAAVGIFFQLKLRHRPAPPSLNSGIRPPSHRPALKPCPLASRALLVIDRTQPLFTPLPLSSLAYSSFPLLTLSFG